jgi:hypothetical protein
LAVGRRPAHFAELDFGQLYVPFAARYMDVVRRAGHPDWLCFVELPPHDLGVCDFPQIQPSELRGAVHAPHWYDQLTLFLGRFIPWAAIDVKSGEPALGFEAVRKQRTRQVKELDELAQSHFGGVPTLLGEVRTSCHATPCLAMPRRAMSPDAMRRNGVRCDAMRRDAMRRDGRWASRSTCTRERCTPSEGWPVPPLRSRRRSMRWRPTD